MHKHFEFLTAGCYRATAAATHYNLSPPPLKPISMKTAMDNIQQCQGNKGKIAFEERPKNTLNMSFLEVYRRL